jgi:hypothetical protein
MSLPTAKFFRIARSTNIALAVALLALAGAAHARVARIVIDSTTALTGQDSAYEQVRGLAIPQSLLFRADEVIQ